MDELIGRLVADEGIDRNAAEAAVGATRQFIAYARGKVGEDVLGEIVGAIPGLAQFV